MCAGLGGLAHPCEAVDVLAEGVLEVADESEHFFFGGRGEVFLDIELAEGFAEHAVGHGEGALPAGLLLFHAAEHLVHAERGVDEVIAEIARCGVHIACGHIVAQHLNGCVGYQAVDSRIAFGLADDDAVHSLHTLLLEVAREVYRGIFLGEVGHAARVVACGRVAELLAAHGCACERRLDGHGVVGEPLRGFGVHAGKGGEFSEIFAVGVTHFRSVLVVLEIVVAVAEAEAALAPVHHVDGGVFHVRFHACAEECAYAGHGGHEVYDVFALGGIDFFKVVLQGLRSFFVEARAVHAHGVEVGDFLCVAAFLGSGCVEAEHEVAHLLAVQFAELVECAVAGVFGCERVGFHPSSACVVVEVGTRLDGGVEVGAVHAVAAPCGAACQGSGQCNDCK